LEASGITVAPPERPRSASHIPPKPVKSTQYQTRRQRRLSRESENSSEEDKEKKDEDNDEEHNDEGTLLFCYFDKYNSKL
jgi:hypothetical protein